MSTYAIIAATGLLLLGGAVVLANYAAAGLPVASLTLAFAVAGAAILGFAVTHAPHGLRLDVAERSDDDPGDLPQLRVPPGRRGPASVLDDAPPPARCSVCDRPLRRDSAGVLLPCAAAHPGGGRDSAP